MSALHSVLAFEAFGGSRYLSDCPQACKFSFTEFLSDRLIAGIVPFGYYVDNQCFGFVVVLVFFQKMNQYSRLWKLRLLRIRDFYFLRMRGMVRVTEVPHARFSPLVKSSVRI